MVTSCALFPAPDMGYSWPRKVSYYNTKLLSISKWCYYR